MPNFANIVITGHIGGDWKLTYLSDNTPVLRFNVAVNTGYGDKKTCTWYRCSMFGRQAESVNPHLAKGKAVTISGEPRLSSYTSEQGKVFTNIEIRVNQFAFAGGGQSAGGADTDAVPF